MDRGDKFDSDVAVLVAKCPIGRTKCFDETANPESTEGMMTGIQTTHYLLVLKIMGPGTPD
jgi:hypothetical protein